MTYNQKLITLFNGAADTMVKHGAVAGRYGSIEEGGFCALGAMHYVSREQKAELDLPVEYTAADELARILNLPYEDDNYNNGWGMRERSGAVAAWSNNLVDAGRADKVIEGFRLAAQKLQANENE